MITLFRYFPFSPPPSKKKEIPQKKHTHVSWIWLTLESKCIEGEPVWYDLSSIEVNPCVLQMVTAPVTTWWWVCCLSPLYLCSSYTALVEFKFQVSIIFDGVFEFFGSYNPMCYKFCKKTKDADLKNKTNQYLDDKFLCLAILVVVPKLASKIPMSMHPY